MGALIVISVIIGIVLFILLLAWIFSKIYDEFEAKEVFLVIIFVAFLVGFVWLSFFVSVHFGKLECDYTPAITKFNITMDKDVVVENAYYTCYYDILGSKSSTMKKITINEYQTPT